MGGAHLVRKVIGGILIVVALLALIVSLISVLDPEGAKLADDGDPFGDPGPWTDAIPGLVVACAVGAGGVWLVFGRASRAHSAASPEHR